MRYFILLALVAVCTYGWAQPQFQSRTEAPVLKHKTVQMADFEQSNAFIEYVEYPKPGGKYYHKFLTAQKEKSAALFPQTSSSQLEFRTVVDTPEMLNNFAGNSWSGGIPLDNHLATNNEGQVITVVNTQMVVLNTEGFYQKVYNLDDFWASLGEDDRYFDPRIMFDPMANRFIMAMMQDYDCTGSNIVFAFSASSDPTGEWHLYSFDGCPNGDATFADFPMISVSDSDLFFTYNAVYQDSSWQTGFNETYIYQIDKTDGYSGSDLNWRSWSDINLNGRLLRYICPLKYATPEMGSEMYFMSNRSFDIQNDTIWMVHINGNLDDPNLNLEVQYMLSDIPYGVPPEANQPKDRLQTNDARVLDGFMIGDQIQFVSSTVDPNTGLSAIFHGVVDEVSLSPILTVNVLGDDNDHRAYPGIAYTGINPDDRDAIIVALHASPDRFPGNSAIYYDFGYSDWMTIKEGQRNIDMFKVNNPFGVDPTLERWGDYVGIQPQYDEEGTVYTAAVYGKPGSVNDTWVGYLSRPGVTSSTSQLEQNISTIHAFPNPSANSVTIEVEIAEEGQILTADIYDLAGRHLERVLQERVTHGIPFRFHYNPTGLSSGTYLIHLSLDGKQIASETLVRQ